MHPRIVIGIRIVFILSQALLSFSSNSAERLEDLVTGRLPDLPAPVANNAVASLTSNDTQYLISFSGLGSGRKHSDIHSRTFVYDDKTREWKEHPPVPGSAGRLAATATSVGALAYVFGNVNLVQQYDTMTDTWVQATPLPGKSLFGHDGIGYDGNPSEPARNALLFDFESMNWKMLEHDAPPTMDHRGLVAFEGHWLTAGGMLATQQVTNTVVRYTLTSAIVKQSRP